MSKYAIVVVREHQKDAILELLKQPGWNHTVNMGEWVAIYHGDGAASSLPGSTSIFKGWYIDHVDERLVFGNCSPTVHPSPNEPREGCYIVAERRGQTISIGNDLFCQLPLIYFQENDVFACSDSLFAISEIRRSIGLNCKLNDEVAKAREWTRTLGQQNQSDETIIKNVHTCGIGCSISLDLSNESLQLKKESVGAPSLFATEFSSYVEGIREGAIRMARHIASLAQCGETISCSLSGGHDSRAVFAAASLLSDSGVKLNVTTERGSARDLAVVEPVAATAGIDILDQPTQGLVKNRRNQLAVWYSHSAGLYDRFEVPPDFSPTEGLFTMGGHGGELLKGMWRWWSIDWLTLGAPLRSQKALRAQCRRGLDEMGVNRRAKWSAEWHYLGYRNAIHGGRRAAHYMHHSSPLMERSLVGLARSDVSDYRAPKRNQPSVVTDLIVLFRPDLAAIGFDDPKKNLSGDSIARRVRQLGGTIDKSCFRAYTLHGNPKEAKLQSSPVFLRAALAKGFDGNWSTSAVVDLALTGAERCPAELQSVYGSMKAKVLRARDGERSLSHDEGILAGKLMGLLLVDP